MFERYTEKARRVIFFARYEASQFGAHYIETEHLLLGLLREDKALANRLLGSFSGIESVRKQIESHTPKGEKVSTSVDMPLSHECKRVLAHAAKEQEQSGQNHIAPAHFVLGLLLEDKCYAAELLRERGVTPDTVREAAKHSASESPLPLAPLRAGGPEVPPIRGALAFFAHDLTEEASEGTSTASHALDGVVNEIIEVLGRRTKCNPVLIGDDPKSRMAVVKRLAQRVVSLNVPEHFVNKRILSLDLSQVGAGTTSPDQLHKRLSAIFDELASDPHAIAFLVDDLETLFGSQADGTWKDAAIMLAPALNIKRIHCICMSKPAEFHALLETHPLLASKFTAVDVPPQS